MGGVGEVGWGVCRLIAARDEEWIFGFVIGFVGARFVAFMEV